MVCARVRVRRSRNVGAAIFWSFAWLKSCFCRARIMCHPHVFVLTLFDYSTFLSLLTIFSLIILSFLLPINFIF